MELEVYKKSDFYEDYIDSQKEYYERTNADAYFAERLAEKDKEIALLKERICNGDVSRITWIDACLDKDKEIDELKDKCQMHDFFWEGCGFAKRGFKNTIAVSEAFDRLEAENAELKQKLESVQASMYCDVVDAGMENRRLKRALWLARAMNARNSYLKWNLFANFESEDKLFTIDEYDETPGVTDFSTLRTYAEWCKVWQNVGRKCLKKAEEYK